MSSWYEKGVKRTLNHDYSRITPEQIEILTLASGACGESGELYNKLKKGIIHEHGYDLEEISEEIGDTIWYLTGLAIRLGLDLDDIMVNNIDKLNKRYPDGFDTDKSKNRKD